MYIDIHSHLTTPVPLNSIRVQDKLHFSGIHPWFIDSKSLFDDKNLIESKLNLDQWLLIGETGLDRLKSNVDFNLQLEVFCWHLELAQKKNRPVVIHCLKAHSDFLEILKKNQYKLTFLIHDYSGGEKELKEYLKFNIYFFFGRSLFRDLSKAQMVFKKVPTNKVFLETDDQVEFSIVDIYNQAQKLRPEIAFESICEKNLEAFFANFKHVSSTDIINHYRV